MALSHVAEDARTELADARAFFVYQSSPIRGLCVLAVIAIHVTGILAFSAPAAWVAVLLVYSNALARFAVPLFLMLSGFHLSLNPRNERAGPFYRRTVRPLVAAYLAYSTVYAGVTHPLDASFPLAWLQAVLTGTAYGHLWFIPVILELYLLHPLLRRLYRRRKHPSAVVFGALTVQVCAALVGQLAQPLAAAHWWARAAAVPMYWLPHAGNFLAGYYVADHAEAIGEWLAPRSMRVAAATLWLGLAGLVAGYWLSWDGAASPLQPAIPRELPVPLVGPVFAAAAFAIFVGWSWRGTGALSREWVRLVRTCGLYAYGLYYIHPLVLLVVSWALTNLAGLSWNDAAFYAAAFAAVPLLSILAIKVLVRLPLTRYLA